MNAHPSLVGLALLLACFVSLWLLSLYWRDASIVDPFWGPSFIIVTFGYVLTTSGAPDRRSLVLALVAIWGSRLGAHLLLRNPGRGEDFRYRAWRVEHGSRWWWRSLLQVFVLQAVIAWVVSWPLLAAVSSPEPPHLTWVDVAGVGVWMVGMGFETIGDWQLARFKADPANRARVMDGGLWRYTRHPNYFGDALVWWGLFLPAAATPAGWWTAVSPALMTFLLMRVSGVALLEATLKTRKPGYAEYVARTSAFVPWPSRVGRVRDGDLL
jgi:steroid 5-alpha reductase family enzyme